MGPMHGRANATGRRRKEARPRELLDAALALFVEKGFAGSRAEDIAARAGVSKATLYLYFASKDDLLKRLIADGFESRVGIGKREAEDDVASGELLRDALTAWRSALMEGDAGGILKLVTPQRSVCSDGSCRRRRSTRACASGCRCLLEAAWMGIVVRLLEWNSLHCGQAKFGSCRWMRIKSLQYPFDMLLSRSLACVLALLAGCPRPSVLIPCACERPFAAIGGA